MGLLKHLPAARSQANDGAEAKPGQIGLAAFLVILAQLALVLWAVKLLRIGEIHGFLWLLPWIFGGFSIHAWLPHRLRMPFFLLLSLASIVIVVGAPMAARLIPIGLLLIGLCHLPIPFAARVGLIVSATVGLGFLRVGWPHAAPSAPLILPILGSMFMFRLILYLYELRYVKPRCSPWQRLSYFFMVPNVCFPLFPVVDFSNFRRNYYDDDAARIYQKGLTWMSRGLTHLVLYRLVYYYLASSPEKVTNTLEMFQYMLSSYLLYLRVSGQFHLIVGVLCLFGFNLPETHHRYLLASGVNDFWRRINIYWKDFVMKVFYYPAYMRLRKGGTTRALILSTLLAFLATWLLHSYQWFWLRGRIPLEATDAIFWGLLGALVVVNSLYQAKRGRKASLGKKRFVLKDALGLSLRTVATFSFISILWSFWSGTSISEWVTMVKVLRTATAAEVGWVVLVLVTAVGAGVAIEYLRSRQSLGAVAAPSLARAAFATSLTVLVLLSIGLPVFHPLFGERGSQVAASLRDDRFNQRDKEMFERGYYEALIGVDKFTSQLWWTELRRPPDWKPVEAVEAMVRHTGDSRRIVLRPSIDLTYKRARLRTNRWGMRDKEYEVAKPSGVYRVALLGASYAMGDGVANEEVFEALVEERLNREHADGAYQRYEILNFAVGGRSVIENAILLEGDFGTSPFDFEPDVLIKIGHSRERVWTARSFTKLVRSGVTFSDPLLEEIQRSTHIAPEMSQGQAIQALWDRTPELVSWGNETIVENCRRRGVLPVWLYLPLTDDDFGPSEIDAMMEEAQRAGFTVWKLQDVYGDDVRTLQVAPWDRHPNARGHQRIAKALYALLRENEETLDLRLGESTQSEDLTDGRSRR